MSKSNVKHKKIYIYDEGGAIPVKDKSDFSGKKGKKQTTVSSSLISKGGGRKRSGKGKILESFEQQGDGEITKKWFEIYTVFNTTGDIQELKEHELIELQNLCKTSFESNLPLQLKQNPSDVKWLETALHKGTSKDRANAGALLVQSNPLANLPALDTLISLSKLSNKSSSEVISVLSDVFVEALLPSHRKLLSFSLRGADWKSLKKREEITNEERNKILAHWHFENELKQLYFEFLKNVQASIQTGQEANKNVGIVAASKLLAYAPEKEQMILSMLINKLGDPSNKIASKALYHLSEVATKHPNMCGVMTTETEKLLFRNNISESAQHFALCFLAQVAPRGHPTVCTKLVNICFDFFKVLVQKGSVNNKTMQAILRCLQKAIVEAKPINGSEIMTKDMEDTIYRLVHMADVQISIQTLSLLLQLVLAHAQKPDRFYNALYKKMLDLNLTSIGAKTASQFLHIVHRAIHVDQNMSRAQAFIKRLLQIALYMPPQITCGCLIIINKLMKSRRDLHKITDSSVENLVKNIDVDLSKFDSDGEEVYQDVHSDDDVQEEDNAKEIKAKSSWHHVNMANTEEKHKTKEIYPTTYNPYNRVPAFCGAEFALQMELYTIRNHFNPTIKVFAENIIERKPISYYGDPLRDFSLTHFLERFAFKNPKKIEEQNGSNDKPLLKSLYNKGYTSHGARGQAVTALTKLNCTEDELFILNYLERKREKQMAEKSEIDDVESVDDNEFQDYLDSLCKKVKGTESDDEEDFDVDYMKELGSDLRIQKSKVSKKNKSKTDEGGDESGEDDDWSEDDDDASVVTSDDDMDTGSLDNGLDSDEGNSISLEQDESHSNSENISSEDEIDKPASKKLKKFSELNGVKDMSSLFAAADDFAELLESTGKIKGHGTSNEIFNKDKSSVKQLKWEEKRHSKPGKFKRK